MKTFTYKDSDVKTISAILKKLQSIQGVFLRTKTHLGSILTYIGVHSNGYQSVDFSVDIVTGDGVVIKRCDCNFMKYSHRTTEECRVTWKTQMENLINSLNENYAEV